MELVSSVLESPLLPFPLKPELGDMPEPHFDKLTLPSEQIQKILPCRSKVQGFFCACLCVSIENGKRERGKNRKRKIDCLTRCWKELNSADTWCEWREWSWYREEEQEIPGLRVTERLWRGEHDRLESPVE